jgi:hypothetical protein
MDSHSEMSGSDHAASAAAETTDGTGNTVMKTAATIGVVAVAAAIIEIGLIPGIVIGVAATLAPKYLPRMGAGLQPLFKQTVRGVYGFGRKTREVVSEAHEQVQDIVAEMHAETTTPATGVVVEAAAPHKT